MKSVIRIIAAIVMLTLMMASPALAVPSGATAAAASPAPSGQLPTIPPYVSPTAGVSPNADGTTAFTLTELGMTVLIPGDLYVFTQSITPENTNPAVFGLTGADFTNYLQAHNIYLNAVASQVSYEINISMVSPPGVQAVTDFNKLSDAELKAFIQSQTAIYQTTDYQYGTAEIYTGNTQAKFLKSDISSTGTNGSKTFGIQYFTIHDAKAISICMTTYSASKVTELTPMLTKLLNTATFSKDTVVKTSPSAPASSSASAQAGTSATKPSASVQPSTSVKPSASAQPSTSVQASASAKPSSSVTADTGTVFGSASALLGFLGDNTYVQFGALFLAMFILMTVPMLIYRFAVRKEPLNRSRGALVVGVDGLVFAVLGAAYYLFLKGSVFILACVVLWAVVNFFVLTLGREREIKETETPKGLYPIIMAEETGKKQTTQPAQSSNMTVNKTCKNCFAVNLATSKVCFYCGAKLEDDDDNKDTLDQ